MIALLGPRHPCHAERSSNFAMVKFKRTGVTGAAVFAVTGWRSRSIPIATRNSSAEGVRP